MIVVKEGETFIVADEAGQVHGEAGGVYRADSRYLKTWRWSVENGQTLSAQPLQNELRMHVARTNRRRVQEVGLSRSLVVTDAGLVDAWTLENTTLEPQECVLRLAVEGEFLDMMARWIEPDADAGAALSSTVTEAGVVLSRRGIDGVRLQAEVTVKSSGSTTSPEPMCWAFELAPRAVASLTAEVKLMASNDHPTINRLPSYEAWREGFAGKVPPGHRPAYARAVDDLRMLLLPTEAGPYPAAGVPWFVAMFGRDALITAFMLLRSQPQVALTVLEALAARQGVRTDAFTEEAPGKILHEVRHGELSRTGRIPFGRYYGSIDATPLFIILLDAYVTETGKEGIVHALEDAWRGALDFIQRHEDGDGLLSFDPSGSGLGVQSWKDSPDSMNHADGRPAEPPLAVVEVQAYAAAALEAAGRLFDRLGDRASGEASRSRAHALKGVIHERYWLDELGTYAMALDREGAPLRVRSSDAGHLLWCGVVPDHVAPRLAQTLLGDDMFSGWGLRTLGENEARYNPVSYHNGAVWPHDTALFAGGLYRYGMIDAGKRVTKALFDLAGSQPLQRMPELISGFRREPDFAPIPYTHACKPQAWSAASLIYLTDLLGETD